MLSQVDNAFNSMLDAIKEARNDREAEHIALSISKKNLNTVLIFHICGAINRVPESINGDRLQFHDLRAVELTVNGNYEIYYEDVDYRTFWMVSDRLALKGPSNLVDMLYLLWFARDRADALVYLNSQMREERLNHFALNIATPSNFVTALVAKYRRIEQRLS